MTTNNKGVVRKGIILITLFLAIFTCLKTIDTFADNSAIVNKQDFLATQAKINDIQDHLHSLDQQMTQMSLEMSQRDVQSEEEHKEIADAQKIFNDNTEKVRDVLHEGVVGTWTLLVATLTLFAGVLAFFGYSGITYVQDKIKEAVDNMVRPIVNRKAILVQMSLSCQHGYAQYLDYLKSGSKHYWLLLSAKRNTQYSLNEGQKWVSDSTFQEDEKIFKELKIQCAVNYMYYVAMDSGSSFQEKDEALIYASDIYKEFIKLDHTPQTAEWLESCAFVMHVLGDLHQKKLACNIINKLTTNPCLPRDWRNNLVDEIDWKNRCPETTPLPTET